MTDKKFTDDEIIKALECCISTTTDEACTGCPFNKQKLCDKDQWALEKYSLDFINRQKAEIEQWQEEANRWQILLCHEIDNKGEVKAEAYKEFANQIKMHKRRMRGFDLCNEFWDYAVLVEDIDNILKTMVGEEE